MSSLLANMLSATTHIGPELPALRPITWTDPLMHAGKQASLRVCFLRHAFGLGEHYNSVKPLSAESAGGEDGFQTVGADTKEQAAPIGDDDALS